MAGAPGALVLRRGDDGRVVCEHCVVADTTLRRLRGLLGRRELRPGDGLVWAARPGNGRPRAPPPAPVPATHYGDGAGRDHQPIRVLLGSRDDRFLRLARFLLTRNDFAVESTKRLPSAVAYVERHGSDVVVLDASDSLSDAARTVAAIEALNPQVRVMLVCDADRPRPTTGLNVVEKWHALETLADEIKLSHAGSRAWN